MKPDEKKQLESVTARRIAAEVVGSFAHVRPNDSDLTEREQTLIGLASASMAKQLTEIRAELRDQCADLSAAVVEQGGKLSELESLPADVAALETEIGTLGEALAAVEPGGEG